jgi:hypothetical protein
MYAYASLNNMTTAFLEMAISNSSGEAAEV